MNKAKRLTAGALALMFILFALTGCGKTQGKDGEEGESSVQETTLPDGANGIQPRLSYVKNDDLNPYKAESSVNLNLASLIYEGVFSVDSTYKINPAVGASCEYSDSACYVTLAAGKFSDGTAITAQDVKYSFDLAKENDYYSPRLENITGCDIVGNKISFLLETPDIYAAACLTFPVIKAGSDEVKKAETDYDYDYDGDLEETEEKQETYIAPIGSGRYVPTEKVNGIYLVANKNKSGFNPTFTEIKLEDIKNAELMKTGIEVGNTIFCFDSLSSGSYSRINASLVNVPTNNLVYLGFNGEKEPFANADFRKALSLIIDRSAVASNAFQGHAVETVTPFNPAWSAFTSTKNGLVADYKELLAPLADTLKENEYSLLVNADNAFKKEAAELIVEQCKAAGINLRVRDIDAVTCREYLQQGEFDMYLGEMKLTADMDLLPLLYGGSCSYGVTEEMQAVCAERYMKMRTGESSIMDFVNDFNTEMPFVPLCYRCAAALYTKYLTPGGAVCSDNDIFSNIESWKFTE